MLDQETCIQALQRLSSDQQQLLKLIIPKVLALSEHDTFQSRYLLEQGVPLAQTAGKYPTK